MDFYNFLKLFCTVLFSSSVAYLFSKLVSMAVSGFTDNNNYHPIPAVVTSTENINTGGFNGVESVDTSTELDVTNRVVNVEEEEIVSVLGISVTMVADDNMEVLVAENELVNTVGVTKLEDIEPDLIQEECCDNIEYADSQEIFMNVEETRNEDKSVSVRSVSAEEESCNLVTPTINIGSEENQVETGSDEIEVDRENEVLVDKDDEDWIMDGVENSEIAKLFKAAAKYVRESENVLKLSSDVQMKLYGLHKVAMEGPCREPPPMVLMVSARAKWNSWQKLGNLSPEAAMEQFLSLLSDVVPSWMEENSEDKMDASKSKDYIQANDSEIKVHTSCSSLVHQPCLDNKRTAIEVESLEKENGASSALEALR